MSTTTTTTTATAATTATTTATTPSVSSVAVSAKFKAFAMVFAMSFPVLYVVCDLWNLPMFTYHPATNRLDLGWAAGRKGEGPAMYWYGWTATCLVGGAVLGALATLLSEKWVRTAMIWFLPVLVGALFAWEAVRTGGQTFQQWQAWAALAAAFGLGIAGTMLPERLAGRLSLAYTWVFYVAAVPFLFWSLRPFWEKGGWW